MRLRYTARFKRAYSGLIAEDAARVDKALRMLAEDPRHPGLRVKRIRGTDGIWEARAGLSIRLTFEFDGDVLTLRNVGHHDPTLRDP